MIGPLFNVGEDKYLQISSRLEMSESLIEYSGYYLISIYGTGSLVVVPRTSPKNMLPLRFDDIKTMLPGYILMNQGHARLVVEFVQQWLGDSRSSLLIVQCEAGISRSAGVAAGVLKYLNGDDSPISDHNLYMPNPHVVEMVYNELVTNS